MLKQILTELLDRAVKQAQESGKIPPVTLPEIIIERPQNPEHGDYASSLPLKLARAAGVNPLIIAGEIAGRIPPTAEIGAITVAPPGFINFAISPAWLAGQIDAILEAGPAYSDVKLGLGSRVQIEFVSVNPTGPLHIGHGRGAILGSTLASVLQAAGYRVEKEYYINDAGTQVDMFARSLLARYRQALGISAEVPESGYLGGYMVDLAREIVGAYGARFREMPEAEAVRELGKIGLEKMLAGIRTELERLRVTFDVWFSEKSLYEMGQYDKAMSLLRKGGYLTEKEGATWFASSALGENKDNVVIRSDGSPTYFAADIAYHYNKFVERNFDRVIDIWGADHMGHVSRMKAVLGAMGLDPDRLQVIISQLVTLRSGGALVRISKRSGEIITLRELVDEAGVDACRYFFLSRSADSQMDFDLELAKKQSAENPVYYIQYAHARMSSILRLAAEKGITCERGDVSLLTTAPELTLIRKMVLLPDIVELIARTLEPHHLTYYALDLATVFSLFYRDCRVITDDGALTGARLKLVSAARTVLARALELMGMAAPETM
ncbi:MAG: arginine--tRNA ligase [Chloroflexi bacterium]|nr:arginine--tRNA ligase [Chloroflexota bacterium]